MARLRTKPNGGARRRLDGLSVRHAKMLTAWLVSCLRATAPIDTGNLNASISSDNQIPAPVGWYLVVKVYMAVYGKWVVPKGGGKRGYWIEKALSRFRAGLQSKPTSQNQA